MRWAVILFFFLSVNTALAQNNDVPILPAEIMQLVNEGFYDKPYKSLVYDKTIPFEIELTEEQKDEIYNRPVPLLPVPRPPKPNLPGANVIPQDVLDYRAQQQRQKKKPLKQLNPLRILNKGLLRR